MIQVIFGVCSVASAMLFRALIDAAVAGEQQAFFRAGLLLAALYLGENILSSLTRFLYEWARSSLENTLKNRLFSCLLQKDYAAVTAVHSGEWLTRLTAGASARSWPSVSLLQWSKSTV